MEIFIPIDKNTANLLSKNGSKEGIVSSGNFGNGVYGYGDLEMARNSIPSELKKDTYILVSNVLDNSEVKKTNNTIYISNVNDVQPQKFYRAETEDEYWKRKFMSNKNIDEGLIRLNVGLSKNRLKIKKRTNKDLIYERILKSNDSFIINLNEQSNKEFYLKKLNESSNSNDFNIISELSIQHNMLIGNLKRDVKFIKESIILVKSNDINKFNKFIYETYINEDIDIDNIDSALNRLSNVCVLSFQRGNDKIGKDVGKFSLPAGWTCPFARDCLKKVSRDVNPETGKPDYKRGDKTKYDCYAASQELQYPNVRLSRWQNFDLLNAAKTKEDKVDLILRSLDHFLKNEGHGLKDIRVHESGDFFNPEYMEAWFEVAKQRPDLKFYAYTKSNPYLEKNLDKYKSLDNFSITLSKGGRADDKLEDLDVKQAHIYSTPEEIYNDGKILDLDDNLAKEKGGRDKDFALLIHGIQKGGSENAKNKLRNETFMNYWKNRKELNKMFKAPEDYHMTINDANNIKKKINGLLNSDSIKKSTYDDINKMINYVIKYHKYNFDDKLINILQDKYK